MRSRRSDRLVHLGLPFAAWMLCGASTALSQDTIDFPDIPDEAYVEAESIDFEDDSNVISKPKAVEIMEDDTPVSEPAMLTDSEGMEFEPIEPPKQIVTTAPDSPVTQDSSGRATIVSEGRTLQAETLRYDPKGSEMSAQTNVYLQDEFGNQYFADSATLKNNLSTGEIHNLSGSLVDNSRFAAEKAERKSESLMTLENVSYSPCFLCINREKSAPLWQFRADEIEIDQEAEEVAYENAYLDVLGVPVLYTPYFFHPTPGASNKTGMLFPTYGSTSELGLYVEAPFFYSAAPNMDFTFTPVITSKEGPLLKTQMRHLLPNGYYTLEGSITQPDSRNSLTGIKDGGSDTRGHYEGVGQFDINDQWAWGFDFKRTLDDTYLRRYQLGHEDTLTSEAFVDRVEERDYLGLNVVAFQGLNVEDNSDVTPKVLPNIDYHYEQLAGDDGSRYIVDANALVLVRNKGVQSRRVSSTLAWNKPYITDDGQLISVEARARADLYSIENLQLNGQLVDDTEARFIPELEANWSLPLINYLDNKQFIFEPVVQGILTPTNGLNPQTISNEDSQELEISDTNLFSANKFTGLDRVEVGPRANYGFRAGMTHEDIDVDLLFGQSYREEVDQNFSASSGLDDNFSDYVGRVGIGNDSTRLTYRFRMDKDDYLMRRNEFGISNSNDYFDASASYLYLEEEVPTDDTQEARGNITVPLSEQWKFNSFVRRDLDIDEWLETGAGIEYTDECLRITFGVKREHTRDRDIEPSTSYMLRIGLKNLGDL